MATWMIALFTRWATVNGHNEMAVAAAYPSAGSLGQESGWTDQGQQDGPIITARDAYYCTLATGKVSDAQLTAIQADAHYLILARYQADTDTPSYDDRQQVITTAMKNAFVTYMQNEFGINAAKIPVIANSVGRTRLAVLRDIAQDLRKLT